MIPIGACQHKVCLATLTRLLVNCRKQHTAARDRPAMALRDGKAGRPMSSSYIVKLSSALSSGNYFMALRHILPGCKKYHITCQFLALREKIPRNLTARTERPQNGETLEIKYNSPKIWYMPTAASKTIEGLNNESSAHL